MKRFYSPLFLILACCSTQTTFVQETPDQENGYAFSVDRVAIDVIVDPVPS